MLTLKMKTSHSCCLSLRNRRRRVKNKKVLKVKDPKRMKRAKKKRRKWRRKKRILSIKMRNQEALKAGRACRTGAAAGLVGPTAATRPALVGHWDLQVAKRNHSL